MTERIFVVGHSAITCLGTDIESTWNGLIQGKSGIRRHPSLSAERYLQDLGGMVPPAEPGSTLSKFATLKPAARFLQLGLASASQAWADTGLDHETIDQDRDRVAVVVGSAFGGVDLLEHEQARMAKRQSPAASPFLVPGLVINQAAGLIAQNLGFYGPSMAPANACASGGHSIILGAMFLRSGEADLAICGAAESAFTPAMVNGFATMKALIARKPGDRSETNPSEASRPFSADRAGFVLAEGAGMVVLATESAVHRLGLNAQAELLAWAVNTDGYHLTMPNRERIRSCLTRALAKLPETHSRRPSYYNAHGTSTTVNDLVETNVLKDIFGDEAREFPVSSIKGALGHALGAASAIEAAICVHALQEQLIPPTINHIPDAELDLDYVPLEARPTALETIVSASFGFGGTNNALILGKTTI